MPELIGDLLPLAGFALLGVTLGFTALYAVGEENLLGVGDRPFDRHTFSKCPTLLHAVQNFDS